MAFFEIEPRSGSTICQERWVGVVDDDDSLRTALARALRGNGIRVETFVSAEHYLARALPGCPACLVLDVHLRGMSGFELETQLAAEGFVPPIIFITAHDDMFAVGACCRGPNKYLRKPFDSNALVALIRPHLSAASSEESHALP